MSTPYLLLKKEVAARPETVYWVTIAFSVMAGAVRFIFAKLQIGFSVRRYIGSVVVRILSFLLVSLPLPLFFRFRIFPQDSILSFLAICSVCVVCTGAAAWAVALDKDEREAFKRMFSDWIHKLGFRPRNIQGDGGKDM